MHESIRLFDLAVVPSRFRGAFGRRKQQGILIALVKVRQALMPVLISNARFVTCLPSL